MRGIAVGLALLCAGGCSKGNGLVVVSVSADATAPLHGITALQSTATIGAQTRSFAVPTSGPFDLPPARTFGIDVPSSLSGPMMVHLEARGAGGALIGVGDGTVGVSAGSRADLAIVLNANGAGGGDMAVGPDLSGSPADLAGASQDLSFRGFTIVPTSPATTSSIRGIWASSPTDVWAVDAAGNVWHSGGGASTFTVQASGVGATLYDIAGSGPNDIWATGINAGANVPVAFHNTGGLTGFWPSSSLSPANTILGVFALDATHVWVSGGTTGGSAVMNFSSGAAFTQQTTPTGSSGLNRAWGAMATDVWAVGSVNTLLHFDGVTWTTSAAPSPPPPWPQSGSFTFTGIRGTSASDVYFGGTFGYLSHYNGTAWSRVTTLPASVSANGNFVAVWASGPNDVYLIDKDNNATPANGHVVRFNGGVWSVLPLPGSVVNPALQDVFGTGPNDVWVVGDNGLILHYP